MKRKEVVKEGKKRGRKCEERSRKDKGKQFRKI